jgi:hypothetical protein
MGDLSTPDVDIKDVPLHCAECEDADAAVRCDQCLDAYCELCFQWIHSRGKRTTHTKQKLAQHPSRTSPTNNSNSNVQQPAINFSQTQPTSMPQQPRVGEDSDEFKMVDENLIKLRDAVLNDLEVYPLVERCKYIPLRLTEEERQLLSVLHGALDVSEYTDNVDVLDSDYGSRFWGWGFGFWSQPYSKHERGGPSRSELINREFEEMFNLLLGLNVCANYRVGAQLLTDDSDDRRVEFIQRIFEIARRYKIVNPEKMRNTYGKLMYILQDAVKAGRLPFKIKIPIKTVYSLLKAKGSLHLISDPEAVKLMLIATREIIPDPTKSKEEMKIEADAKSFAVTQIISKYKSEDLSAEDILWCINSIADNNTFITLDRLPIDKMLQYLTTYFTPQKGQCPSLAIYAGLEGSKLTHDHTTQFTFVLQSLMLWREIVNNMFRLWFMTEEDLLSEDHSYHLRDTGQGLNRVQSAPRVAQAMHSILGKVQQQVRSWVGLSVVHLGDRDVPNALMFIDKYTQVSRILGPIAQCVGRLPALEGDPALKQYLDTLGGVHQLRLHILASYFRHGFDGSGSDGGSCIDGRLTSSWNWCSKIEKKPFFPLFLLTGFKGFDGGF